MNKKIKTLTAPELKNAKLVAWPKSILSKFKLPKDSKAGIVTDKNGIPQLFIFDTTAFLDLLSAIDDALVDRMTDEEYHSKSANPAGYLIDEIEARIPPHPEYIQSLKEAVKEANEKGWVPFSKILKNLGFK